MHGSVVRCKYCGNELQPGATRCRFCGGEVPPEVWSSQAQPASAESPAVPSGGQAQGGFDAILTEMSSPAGTGTAQSPYYGGFPTQGPPPTTRASAWNDGVRADELTQGGANVARKPKSRVTYVLLALFLGGFGAHNFYAERYKSAIAQLVLTLFFWWLVIPAFVVGIWVLVEVFTVKKDGNGVPFT